MTPIFADAIDIPIVLFFGIIVLVPLIAFEVFIEALVLKRIWHLPYGELCTFTFFANFWSLLAGIPTKVLNAFLYAHLLPDDIPGYFAQYTFAVAIGSLVYFAVTLLVEGAYAFRWQRRKELGLGRTRDARWWGGGDWGVSYSRDTCGDLTASVWPGLDSGLRINRKVQKTSASVLTVSVRPGLLHLAGFYFGDVAFLQDGRECLFESNGYIYLLNTNEKRLGTFAKGDRFSLLTTRYQKLF